MTLCANETAFLAIVSAAVRMIVYARRQIMPTANRRGIDETIEVDPFPAIVRPGGASKCLTDSLGQDPLFDSD
ncbi:MAG TPA: hypothetical protein VGG64_20850, partial [Pirellulales bacterium]